jgi:hypothetical protein
MGYLLGSSYWKRGRAVKPTLLIPDTLGACGSSHTDGRRPGEEGTSSITHVPGGTPVTQHQPPYETQAMAHSLTPTSGVAPPHTGMHANTFQIPVDSPGQVSSQSVHQASNTPSLAQVECFQRAPGPRQTSNTTGYGGKYTTLSRSKRN